jgi:hypothetical protein
MAKKVICLCNSCSKHTCIDSNGRETIGRQITIQNKTAHFREQRRAIAKSTQVESPPSSSQLQKKPRPLKPTSRTHKKRPSVGPQPQIPDLTGGKLVLKLQRTSSDISFSNRTNLLPVLLGSGLACTS